MTFNEWEKFRKYSIFIANMLDGYNFEIVSLTKDKIAIEGDCESLSYDTLREFNEDWISTLEDKLYELKDELEGITRLEDIHIYNVLIERQEEKIKQLKSYIK